MRKKYADCRRADGDCTICPLVNYGRDCHNRPITKLEWSRRMAGMTQAELAEALHLLCRPLCCWLRHAAEQAGEQVRLLLDGGVSNSAPQITH